MLDEVFATLKATAKGWKDEAGRRRQISGTDAVADTLDYVASELAEQLRQLALATHWLEVPEYARAHGVTPQAVRKWIADGELEALRGVNGRWKIRRGAQRVRKGARLAA